MVEGEQPRHSGSEGAEGALKGPHVCSQLWGLQDARERQGSRRQEWTGSGR